MDAVIAELKKKLGETGSRYAKKILETAINIRKGGNGKPGVYQIVYSQTERMPQMHNAYLIGEQPESFEHHKVIMMVGATGSGKSTVIDALANYIFGVEWEDEFRFKVTDEPGEWARSEAHSQTEVLTSYTIKGNKRHKIQYTLTLIDTPGFGDTKGIERDESVTEQIKHFFTNPENHSVDHIDGVCFVAQASEARLTTTQRYIFDSILALFGKDVEPNILLLLTFHDSGKPKIMDAIKAAGLPYNNTVLKFNNSALYESNTKMETDDSSDEDDKIIETFWNRGRTNIKKFFEALEELSAVSLTLSKDVLEERERLENTVRRLEEQFVIKATKKEELCREREMLKEHKKDIEENKSFQFKDKVGILEKIDVNYYATNCPKCNYTCHHPCKRANIKKRKNCRAMKNGQCTVCPGKCSWERHAYEKKIIKYKLVEQTKSYVQIEGRYYTATHGKKNVEKIIEIIEAEIADAEKTASNLITECYTCINKLEEIALRPRSTAKKEFINFLIHKETTEVAAGWENRKKELEKMLHREETLSDAMAKVTVSGAHHFAESY